MTEQNCRTCGHYELYKMITSGRPYGYSGDIPCLRCNRFRVSNDEHTASDNRWMWGNDTGTAVKKEGK
jgi:hypothetical protein